MKFLKDYRLRGHNCFGVDVRCKLYCLINKLEGLDGVFAEISSSELPGFVLGGGSNVLFSKDFPGLVVHIGLAGVTVVDETASEVLVRVGAGEIWHDFVLRCLHQGWHGLENLALIPGTVGAAPIQNIGAYGVELSECCESVEYFERETGIRRELGREDCKFSYRDSIFKQELRDKVIVTAVTFRLSRQFKPFLGYADVADVLRTKSGQESVSARQLVETVIAIRQRKLPDPLQLPNCGSFFKNPVIPVERYESLQNEFGQVPGYRDAIDRDRIKVPAAWLLDKAGWKGQRQGAVGVHEQQAVVIVNYGGASGRDIVQFSRKLQNSIRETFAIELEPEVQIVQ